MSMFKSAATKIAHNSTIPALGGNRDLRPLQDLILAEKQVLVSLQRLSTDFAKAAEALRIWGSGEGDDLGDILGSSTTLLTLWSNALSQYAGHGHPMRDYLKSVRTREENLDDLKRRRKAVCSKAESAERKLSKMSPEHKNLTIQTDSLNALRAEIRNMDSEIMTEEAALGDFKRSTSKAWMGLKFGGLLECAEKGTIIGEYGKLIVTEIPEEHTQPGMSRSLYYGRAKTEQLLSEAHGCINEVVMSTVPSARTSTSYPQHTPQPPPQNPFGTPQSGFQGLSMQHSGGLGAQHTGGHPPNEWSPHIPPAGAQYLPAPQGLGTGEFLNQPSSPTAGPGSPILPNFSQYPQIQPEPQSQASPRGVDDFGVGVNGPIDQPGPGSGGRFATFPVKNRPSGLSGYTLSDPPNQLESDLFTSSVAQALSSSQISPPNAQQPQPGITGRSDVSYEVSHAPTHSPPPGPPPGAAMQPPAGRGTRLQQEERYTASDEEGGLAYMSNPDDDTASRHVRFGEVSDIDDELGRRGRLDSGDTSTPQQHSHQEYPHSPLQQQHPYQEQQEESQPEGQPPQYQAIPPTIETARASLELSQPNEAGAGAPEATALTTDARFQNQRRVPPPSVDPPEDEERALNAAAAREVSRELDALANFSPPPTSPPTSPDNPSLAEAHDRQRQSSLSLGHGTPQIDSSPLAPPQAPFSEHTHSPHPDTDSPTLPYSNSPSVQYSYAQAPTQYPQQPPAPQHHAQESVQYRQRPPSAHYGNASAQYQPQPSSTTYYTQESVRYQEQLPPPGDDVTLAGTPRNGSGAPIKDELPRLPPVASQFSPSLPSQTPLEYPNRGSAASPMAKSTTSLNAQVPLGTRTISAAAFRRPQRMASGDLPPSLADGRSTSPLSVKKRLPSSPYPQQREASPNRRGRSGSPAQAPAAAPTQVLPPIPTQDDDYDYLGAYVDTGSLPDAPGDARSYVQPAAGNHIRAQGYGEGRFATDLDGRLR